jgi:hypothetical protein
MGLVQRPDGKSLPSKRYYVPEEVEAEDLVGSGRAGSLRSVRMVAYSLCRFFKLISSIPTLRTTRAGSTCLARLSAVNADQEVQRRADQEVQRS